MPGILLQELQRDGDPDTAGSGGFLTPSAGCSATEVVLKSRRAVGMNARVLNSNSGRGVMHLVPSRISGLVLNPISRRGRLSDSTPEWNLEMLPRSIDARKTLLKQVWTVGQLAGILMLLAGCGGSRSSPSAPTFDFAVTDAVVEDFLAEAPGLDGASLIIVHREWGVLHHRAFGSFDQDRISLVASSSKVITAGILNRLADDGLLDLQQPLEDFLGWESTFSGVTTADLISNSSGLVGLLPNLTFEPYMCQWRATGTLLDCGKSIFTATEAAPEVIPRQTAFRYGGGQWQVAGAVAEAVSGKSWERLFEEIYEVPCGLTASGFSNPFDGDPLSNLLSYPAQFDGDPGNLPQTRNPSMEAGLYTTSGDYGKLLLMQLRGGRCGENFVMSANAVEQMQANQIDLAWGGKTESLWAGYGYGWWVDTERDGWLTDPGAFGAVPWLDLPRGYGAMIIVEANIGLGSALGDAVLPSIEAAIDNPS